MENTNQFEDREVKRRFNLIYHKAQEQRLSAVWKKVAEAGINAVLIKGWAAAQLYPEPSDRQYTDADLVVSPDDYEKALEFSGNEYPEIAIDWHSGLRQLDEISFETLYKNSRKMLCGDTEIRIPSEEDHLRILAVHWLSDGGEYKDKLSDICNAVKNRSKSFDWNKCLGSVSLKRRRWIVCVLVTANRYMELDIDDIPLSEDDLRLPEWYVKTIEKEWKSDTRLIPLSQLKHDRKAFLTQLRKRLPPNPITATVFTNGYFDDGPRFFYQVKNVYNRIPSSIKNISNLTV